MKHGTAIIIGAGPAGLTAGLELLRHSGIKPILLESSHAVGGLSRTVVHNGNRMDIGGHRFFSKSDRVMQWWLDLMPIEGGADESGRLEYKGQMREIPPSQQTADPDVQDRVMLVRSRKSRIYFRRRFFDYPIQLTAATVFKMGILRTMRCGFSYLWSALRPRRPELTLEDFLINRFGKQLYLMFYKSYSEKVWGVPCSEISAEWGAQRVKGLSLKSVAMHYLQERHPHPRERFKRRCATEVRDISHREIPLSQARSGSIVGARCRSHPGSRGGGNPFWRLRRSHPCRRRQDCLSVEAVAQAGERVHYSGDYFLSTMPVRDLVRGMDAVPTQVSAVSEGLRYRDFIIVGLLVKKLAVTENDGSPLKDNWIYIQEQGVKAGRLQIFQQLEPVACEPARSRLDRPGIFLQRIRSNLAAFR